MRAALEIDLFSNFRIGDLDGLALPDCCRIRNTESSSRFNGKTPKIRPPLRFTEQSTNRRPIISDPQNADAITLTPATTRVVRYGPIGKTDALPPVGERSTDQNIHAPAILGRVRSRGADCGGNDGTSDPAEPRTPFSGGVVSKRARDRRTYQSGSVYPVALTTSAFAESAQRVQPHGDP